MVFPTNNPNRMDAENKCFNPFHISTDVCGFIYCLALPRDNLHLWYAGWIRWSEGFFGLMLISDYLSYLLTTRPILYEKNLPVNITISSNSSLFSFSFHWLPKWRKKQIMAEKSAASLTLFLQFMLLIFFIFYFNSGPQWQIKKSNGFETSLFLLTALQYVGNWLFQVAGSERIKKLKILVTTTNLFALRH